MKGTKTGVSRTYIRRRWKKTTRFEIWVSIIIVRGRQSRLLKRSHTGKADAPICDVHAHIHLQEYIDIHCRFA